MTDIEKKALALLNEVAKEMGLEKVSSLELDMPGERALIRAIEQYEAFRQEVSDVVEAALSVFNQLVLDERGEIALRSARLVFARFIIPKPDPVSQIAIERLRIAAQNLLDDLLDGGIGTAEQIEALEAALAGDSHD